MREPRQRGAHRPPAAVAPRPPPDPRRARRVPRRRRGVPRDRDRGDARDRARVRHARTAVPVAVEVPLGDGRVVRVRGKADRVDRRADGDLVVIDYKTGLATDVHGAQRTTIRSRRARTCSSPSTRTRPAPRTARPTPRSRRTTGSSAGARTGASATSSTPPSTTCSPTTLRTIVDGIEGGVFPSRPDEPAPSPFVTCAVLRSRRHGHHRPLAGVGAQVRRARARRVPQPRGRRSSEPARGGRCPTLRRR